MVKQNLAAKGNVIVNLVRCAWAAAKHFILHFEQHPDIDLRTIPAYRVERTP